MDGKKVRPSIVDTLYTVYVTSAITGVHCIVISEPGWGKTEVANAIARQIMCDQPHKYIMLALDASTTPDVVNGFMDISAFVDGRREIVVDGSAKDPRAGIILLDEIFRANTAVYDALLQAFNDVKLEGRVTTYWATTNFVAEGKRTEALIDRIGLWCWLPSEFPDVRGIVRAHLVDAHEGGTEEGRSKKGIRVAGLGLNSVPTWGEILKIRKTKATERAADAVTVALSELCEAAVRNGFYINPRRTTEWAYLVHRLTVYHTGTADYNEVPIDVLRTLRWAYPATSREEARRWEEVVLGTFAPVEAAIEAIAAEAYNAIKLLATKPLSGEERVAVAMKLSEILQSSREKLEEIAPGDPRAERVIEQIQEWFRAVVSGGMPNV